MFEPTDKSRVFGVHPGADFPRELVAGIKERTAKFPPEYQAKIELFVNTRRMQRRIQSLFEEGKAKFLPRIRLVTDLSGDFFPGMPAPPVSDLRRRFQLVGLVSALLDKEPDLAPRGTIFDLADSLALLLTEMNDEGVSIEDILNLDVSDRSGHWERSQKFLKIANGFCASVAGSEHDTAARQRAIVEMLRHSWALNPPKHPIIIAGSTGSRGTTAMLLKAVAKLPMGAVVLPGFDFDLPGHVWEHLSETNASEGHPQYRLAKVIEQTGLQGRQVEPWQTKKMPGTSARNKLVSLALRPAPVTDQWLLEGPKLGNLGQATENISLVEAPSDRMEASVIALILRKAVDDGQVAALVTPDKTLSRRVKTALDRWRIEPDVSAGEPLETTAPGRLFRHVSELMGADLGPESVLVLLKHPLVHSSNQDRNTHNHRVRGLELHIRQNGPFKLFEQGLKDWCDGVKSVGEKNEWFRWIMQVCTNLANCKAQLLQEQLKSHLSIVESLVNGPFGKEPTTLWDSNPGRELRTALSEFQSEAHILGKLEPADYRNMFLGVIERHEVRDPVKPHPSVMIWGALESRAQGADLVILGGLNEGTWPSAPAPDPWLNRNMRLEAGLLLPDRHIGLSAHDFQQAINAKTVVLSRAIRNDESPSVPSRWLSRINNLLAGVSDDGKKALESIQERGQKWLQLAEALEEPIRIDPAPRPAPCPPVEARPNSLSVTGIGKLIRDPYAIYARQILGLNALKPLQQSPDARLRGIVLHSVMEAYVKETMSPNLAVGTKAEFVETAARVLAKMVPWPATRLLWQTKLEDIADQFLSDEVRRRKLAAPASLEIPGRHFLADVDFFVTAIADRIDETAQGNFFIYDYKTGKLPTASEMKHFEKQLFLEAVILSAGGFKELRKGTVQAVAHIGLGSDPKFNTYQISAEDIKQTTGELIQLVSQFKKSNQGYSSRRAVARLQYGGDYDHLARYGEWDDSDVPTLIKVGM